MKLQEIIKDPERLFTEGNIPHAYQTEDTPGIHAVGLAKTTEEVKNLVAYAIENDLKIIARGAGTGVAGSQMPLHVNELIIDVSRMNEIIELDEETLTLTVGPGARIGDIQAYAENHGYYYPPDPASKHSSIGGNVSTNAGGMRAVKYGTTRNYVRAMEVVLPTGEVVKLGSLNIKSSSGYDLKDLFIGSEGTLGITTEIKLKLIPMPTIKKSALLAFDTLADATDGVLKLLTGGIEPTALELFERSTIELSEKFMNAKLPSQKGDTYVLMTLDGDDMESITRRISAVQDILKDQAIETIPLNVEEEKLAWNLRDNILIALMEFTVYEMLDEVVPINRFADLIMYTKELQQKHGIRVVNFGHAGDGNVHTVLMREDLDEETWQTRRSSLLDDLYQKVMALGGLPSAEHGIGVVKKPYLEKMIDPNEINLMRKIKKAIDPDNRLNPGKVI